MSIATATQALAPTAIGTAVSGEPYRPDPEKILSGDPVQRAVVLYTSADGRFTSGLWSCEPGAWRATFTEHEFCQILTGHIVVTDADGTRHEYRVGDAFVMPAGFTGSWDVIEPSSKRFVCYE